MMRKHFQKAFVFVILGLLSSALFAQEKTQSYYNTHESEILPDAKVAFQRGDYERAVELCTWHYIIVGNQDATLLQEKAERCVQLSKRMEEFQTTGRTNDAAEVAKTILSINPDDVTAKELISISETPAVDPNTVPPVAIRDTIQQVITDSPIQKEEVQEEQIQEIEQDQKQILEQPTIIPEQKDQSFLIEEPKMHFVMKAGASVLDFNQFSKTLAPGVSLGFYDIGGSRIGTEMGAYICLGLSSLSASMFGVDASLLFRAARGMFPTAGFGFFSCKPTDGGGDATNGLCAKIGLTFLFDEHFCFEIGAKYYPEIKLRGTEQISTAGSTYDFPSSRGIIPGGISPMISFGWAF